MMEEVEKLCDRLELTRYSWGTGRGLLTRLSETQSLICSLQTLNEALTSGNKEQSKAALEKQVRNTRFKDINT